MNKALAELLKLIQKLYGKKTLSKTIGTRTNVITLPDKETKKFLSQELNIEAASDAAVKKGFEDAEKLIADIPKMNDQEILTFKNNLQRMDNRINPPSAEVFEFGTKQPVSREGIASLTEQAGQKTPPGTLMGDLESRINQLRASGEGLEALTKGKGQTLDDILGDVMQSQKAMSKLQDEGLVRAAVRYKMMDDVKKGTLKLPKNLEDVVRGASNEEDVITVFRNNYGEDALEQVDSLIPDFYNMTSPTDAVKKIEKDFPNIKPRKIETKQTMDLEEAAKAEKENILIPDDTEEFATGGRVGFEEGGNIYSMYQNYLNDLQNRASGDFSVPIGNMYQGTNQDGSAETESTQTSPVGSTFNPTMMDMAQLAINPVMGIANIRSRMRTGLSLAERAMDAMGIGRGIGGRTQGYGIDAVNEASVAPDASAGGAAGAAAASAAGANDGPGTGGSFAQGGRVGYAEGNIDPTKEKQIKQMLKMGADESTIASITGATPQQIQFVQQQQKEKKATGGRVGYSTGSIVKGVLLTAKTLSELKPEYLKKLSRLEGYLGSINMEGKGGREAAKKTIEKIDNLKQEYKALEKDLSEKEQLDKFDITDRSKNARGGVAYLMGL